MSDTPTADLLAHAHARGVDLTKRGARLMLRRRGRERARDRIDAIGALIDLASAWGRELTSLAAARRLDAVDGDFDEARDRLVDPLLRLRQREFDAEWERAEGDLRARDARGRHAAFLAELDTGSLGHRATLILLAAADAGLTQPSSAANRAQLWGLCDIEFARRHAIADPDGEVTSRAELIALLENDAPDDPVDRAAWVAEHERWLAHVQPVTDDEDRARAMAADQLRGPDTDRDLAITINRLADHHAFRGDVERVLSSIHRRLADALAREDAGAWRPDPERYQSAVIDRAVEAARQAA